MTEYNNNKFVPQAQTYEVKYLEQKEQQKPKLSLAAKQKIVQRHGSSYQSERLNEINPGYGPMPQSSSDDEETKKFTFIYYFQTTSRVHDWQFEEGSNYKYTLNVKGIDNGRSLLQKLENGSIKVVDKRKDKEEIIADSERTESVKKCLKITIKEFEKEGECHRCFPSVYTA